MFRAACRLVILFLFAFATAGALAQTATTPVHPDMVIDAAVRKQAIDELATQLTTYYVFPDMAEKIVADVRARQQAGDYDGINSARKFAEALNQHMEAVGKDKHVRVDFSREALPPEVAGQGGTKPDPAQEERRKAFARWMGFGLAKFERLEGNIAYIELTSFSDADAGASAVAAFMSNAAGSDALIIDLRNNGGGSPKMIALIASYLFGAEKVRLSDLYWRSGNRTEEFWTNPAVAGTRYGPDKPLYILTSNKTFSAAEGFTYDLKHMKRAVIIGETTRGGANPGRWRRTGEHFETFIPNGRAINPITKANWEGIGVTPDIAVPADQALLTARLLAMTPLVKTLNEPRMRLSADQTLADLQAQLDKLKAPKAP